MSEWKVFSLRDLVKEIIDNRGKNPSSYSDEGIPVIDNFMIKNSKFIKLNESKRFIDEDTYSNFIRNHLKHKDVIITLVGNGYGNVSQAPLQRSVIIQNTIGLSSNDKIDEDFLFYNLVFNKDGLMNLDRGAVQPSIKVSDLLALEINLPSLPEQKAIAEVLTSLDDKIDLLHKQNKTLEQLAETLFRHHFIDNAQDDWKNEEIGSFVKVVDNRGKTPPNHLIENSYPLIEVNALGERLVNYSVIKKYVDEEVFNEWFRNKPKKYDTLVSTVGSIGLISMFVIEKGNIAQNVIALSPNRISPFYLYQILKHKKEELLSLDIGGVQPSIKVPHLLEINIPVPSEKELKYFDSCVMDFFNRMELNQKQIQSLEKLRDQLLPNLMSGEIKLENNILKNREVMG